MNPLKWMRAAVGALLLAGALGVPRLARAQHEGHDMAAHSGMVTGALGIPMDRMGSGTTWIPDAVSLPARHVPVPGWMFMVHGFAFGYYNKQNGPRGSEDVGSINWMMLMASRKVGAGHFQFRTMLSLDPLTVTGRGYPLLLQVGETYRGALIRDRQHPHDFWKELAVLYEHELTGDVGLSLYAAPSGEPALGPVAFMHRPSVMDDPVAPLGHHWQDATHISYGVVSAGIFTRALKLEGSYFNGREPDEDRWQMDPIRFDSYSGRVTANPSRNVTMTLGFGVLNGHERLFPDMTMRRVVGSVMYGAKRGALGQTATTFVWGSNHHHGEWSHSALIESQTILDRYNTVFGRVEIAQRNDEELGTGPAHGDDHTGGPPAPHQTYNTGSVSVGYIRELFRSAGMTTGLGTRWTVNMIPSALQAHYGSAPTALVIYLRVRPYHQ
jgi:hypothetical protein